MITFWFCGFETATEMVVPLDFPSFNEFLPITLIEQAVTRRLPFVPCPYLGFAKFGELQSGEKRN